MTDRIQPASGVVASLDTNDLREQVSKLVEAAPSSVQETARAFVHNVENVRLALVYPMGAATATAQFGVRALQIVGVGKEFSRAAKPTRTPEFNEEVERRVNLYNTQPEQQAKLKSYVDDIRKEQLEQPSIVRAERVMRFGSVILTWTAFETFAGDLWEDTLNAMNMAAHKPLINWLEKKQINITMLFRYGLDLRNQLGTLLKERFTFSNVHDIAKAFALIASSNSKILSNEDALERLAMLRNLIAHRAGYVDAQYLNDTACGLKVGMLVEVSEPDVDSYTSLVSAGAIELLEAVQNTWLKRPATTS